MPEPVAVVPLEGRGDLPFAELRGEALFLHAVRALLAMQRLDSRSGADHPVVVVTAEPDQHPAAVAALDRVGLSVPVEDACSR